MLAELSAFNCHHSPKHTSSFCVVLAPFVWRHVACQHHPLFETADRLPAWWPSPYPPAHPPTAHPTPPHITKQAMYFWYLRRAFEDHARLPYMRNYISNVYIRVQVHWCKLWKPNMSMNCV